MADEFPGLLALSGAREWSDGARLDEMLAGRSSGEVVVVPTGAAYERPDRLVERAIEHFSPLGVHVTAAMVLGRADAEDTALATVIREARFLYLCGGSPLHLRSVLKDSLALDALVGAWSSGAIVAGSAAGAMALSDPMVDPRGGAFTVGLGLVRNIASVLDDPADSHSGLPRTLALGPDNCALLALARRSAVVREPDGTWRDVGEDPTAVYVSGARDGLAALAGKPLWER